MVMRYPSAEDPDILDVDAAGNLPRVVTISFALGSVR